jgi:hypothetical protein
VENCPHQMRAKGFAGFLLCAKPQETHGRVYEQARNAVHVEIKAL